MDGVMLDRAYQLAETLIARLERVIELLEQLLALEDDDRDRVVSMRRVGGRG